MKNHQTNQTFISKVIADGRVTIPKEMREKRGISKGDFVELQVIRKIITSGPKEV